MVTLSEIIRSETKLDSESEFIETVLRVNGYCMNIVDSSLKTKMRQLCKPKRICLRNAVSICVSSGLVRRLRDLLRFAKQISVAVWISYFAKPRIVSGAWPPMLRLIRNDVLLIYHINFAIYTFWWHSDVGDVRWPGERLETRINQHVPAKGNGGNLRWWVDVSG